MLRQSSAAHERSAIARINDFADRHLAVNDRLSTKHPIPAPVRHQDVRSRIDS
jgi:hypothetical protein